MSQLTDKMNEVFKKTGVRTLGDLIEKNRSKLPGIENFPAELRAHSLSPEGTFILPSMYWASEWRQGVLGDTLVILAKKAEQFKLGVVKKAIKALKPKGPAQ